MLVKGTPDLHRQAFQYAQLACEKLKEVGSNMSKVLKHTAGEEAARWDMNSVWPCDATMAT